MKINPEAQLAVKLYRQSETIPNLKPNYSDFDAAYAAAMLCSMARALHRLDEAVCNGQLTDRQFKRRVNLGVAIRKIAESYGLKADHNADPRGYSVYLHFPDGSYNSWGGKETGWGI